MITCASHLRASAQLSRCHFLTTPIMPNKRKPNNTDATPAKKRVKRGRSNRGRLEGMPDMPLDILYLASNPFSEMGVPSDDRHAQIFGHFMPMDLLNISRTAKVFRQFLMARSSAPLWRAARRNVDGLPDCPSFLSEPAYANLVFDTHCHVCLLLLLVILSQLVI